MYIWTQNSRLNKGAFGRDAVARKNIYLLSNQLKGSSISFASSQCETGLVLSLLRLLPTLPTGFFRSRRDLHSEKLALRNNSPFSSKGVRSRDWLLLSDCSG
jgi:hypothetical protein